MFEVNQITENNPKAVFFGDNNDIITALAGYFSEFSVDLYTAQKVEDAFFGDYFIYIGPTSHVYNFLLNNFDKLPRSLFILENGLKSEFSSFEGALKHIKLVMYPKDLPMDTQRVNQMIEFFFSGKKNILELSDGRQLLKQIPFSSTPQKPVQLVNPFPADVVPSLNRDDVFATVRRITEQNEPLISHDYPKTDSRLEPTVGMVSSFTTPNIPQMGQYDGPITIPVREKKHTIADDLFSEENIQKKIGSFFTDVPHGTKSTRISRVFNTLVTISLAISFFFLVVPFFSVILPITYASAQLYYATQSAQSGNLERSQSQFSRAAKGYQLANASGEWFYPVATMVNVRSAYEGGLLTLKSLSLISQGGEKTTSAGKSLQEIISGISGKKRGIDYEKLSSNIKVQLTDADVLFAQAQAQLTNPLVVGVLGPLSQTKILSSASNLLPTVRAVRQQIFVVKSFAALVPGFVGVGQDKKYLILFQNNNELRPGGGFIGSYGILQFKDGQIVDLQVEDVYTADGQLKGHIDPPAALKTYLEQEHWYLRDSNWDPDFVKNATNASWFLEKEMNITVDGVLAIDLTTIEYILKEIGPITLTDFNVAISAETLFEETQKLVHQDFFEGSTQKKDVMGVLARTLFDKLINETDPHQSSLITAFEKSLNERHLMVYFKDPLQQSLVEAIDWDGRFDPSSQCGDACITDTLAVIDANLGVNKVNHVIARSMSVESSLGLDGTIVHQVTLVYKNNSQLVDDDFNGAYKNYARVYIPDDMVIKAVSSENTDIPVAVDIPVASSSSARASSEGSSRVLELWLEVLPQTTKSVTIALTRTVPNGWLGIKQYELLIPKQAGSVGNDISVVMQTPQGWSIVPQTKPLQGTESVAGAFTLEKGNRLTYNSLLVSDQRIQVIIP